MPQNQPVINATKNVADERKRRLYRNAAWIAGIAVALTVRYWSVLTYPTYWDTIFGVFAEAIWLVENDFDYALLWQQPGYKDYGHAIYLISVLPTIYALLLSAFTPVTVFVLVRIFNFLAIALAVILAYRLLEIKGDRRRNRISFVVLLALLAHPMFSGQIVAVGMEIPACVTSFLAGYLMIQGRYRTACAVAVLAFFVKQVGLIIGLANLAFAVLLVCAHGRRRLGALVYSIVPVAIGVIVLELTPKVAAGSLGPVWNSRTVPMAKNCYPDILILVALVALGLLIMAITLLWKCRRRLRIVALLRYLFRADSVTLYSAIYISGMLAVFIFYLSPLPRYWCWCLVFIYMLFARVLARPSRHQAIGIVVALAWLAGSIANTNGALFPRVPLKLGMQLERSNEYLRDVEIHKTVCAWLEENHYNATTITGSPWGQMLIRPGFGYVTRAFPRSYTPQHDKHHPDSERPLSAIPPDDTHDLIFVFKGEHTLGAPYQDTVRKLQAQGYECTLQLQVGKPPLTTRVFRAVRNPPVND
ncbi:MAG: hypothetical protein ACKJSG_02080 [Lentisphaeria bacterium]